MSFEEKKDRVNLWYRFEETVNRLPKNEECLWSHTGRFTWRETYDQACRYGAFFLSQGVKPRDLVASFLQNSPEFMFNWLGCWSIGAAPAMINYHLTGEALVHCVRVSGANVITVDPHSEVRDRIENVRSILEGELGVKIIILDDAVKASINSLPARRPDDKLRRGMGVDFPMCLLYTR